MARRNKRITAIPLFFGLPQSKSMSFKVTDKTSNARRLSDGNSMPGYDLPPREDFVVDFIIRENSPEGRPRISTPEQTYNYKSKFKRYEKGRKLLEDGMLLEDKDDENKFKCIAPKSPKGYWEIKRNPNQPLQGGLRLYSLGMPTTYSNPEIDSITYGFGIDNITVSGEDIEVDEARLFKDTNTFNFTSTTEFIRPPETDPLIEEVISSFGANSNFYFVIPKVYPKTRVFNSRTSIDGEDNISISIDTIKAKISFEVTASETLEFTYLAGDLPIENKINVNGDLFPPSGSSFNTTIDLEESNIDSSFLVKIVLNEDYQEDENGNFFVYAVFNPFFAQEISTNIAYAQSAQGTARVFATIQVSGVEINLPPDEGDDWESDETGKNWECDCPDSSRKKKPNPNSTAPSDEQEEDWSEEDPDDPNNERGAGAQEGMCKHIWAVRLLLRDVSDDEVPTDVPIDYSEDTPFPNPAIPKITHTSNEGFGKWQPGKQRRSGDKFS